MLDPFASPNFDQEKMFEKLDFTAFCSSNHVERAEFCQRLVFSLAEQGFVRLVNHGIPRSVIDSAFETV